jgi:hypothetical protein
MPVRARTWIGTDDHSRRPCLCEPKIVKASKSKAITSRIKLKNAPEGIPLDKDAVDLILTRFYVRLAVGVPNDGFKECCLELLCQYRPEDRLYSSWRCVTLSVDAWARTEMRAQKTRRFFSTSTRPLSPKPQISRNWPNNFYLFPNATLEPLQNPPLPNSTKQSPSLPKRNPRSPWKCSTHTLSTHIIPAAYPRVGRYKPLPPLIDERLDPTQRRERSHEMAKTLSRRQKDVRGIWNGPPLFNVVNRYARNEIPSDKKGVTIVASHATGFPKEVGESAYFPRYVIDE